MDYRPVTWRKVVVDINTLKVPLFCSLLLLTLAAGAAADNVELQNARGISALNEGRYGAALELFREVLAVEPHNLEATFYSGMAESRLGRHEAAENFFLKVLEIDPGQAAAHYELGRLYYVTSRCREAERELSSFLGLSREDPLLNKAQGMIEGCRQEPGPKSYRINVYLGGQYDSNVILEPENPPVRAEDKSDFRGVFFLSASATPMKSSAAQLKAEYSFYQSLHLDLTDFNLHYHRITPEIEMIRWERLRPAVGYSFEYSLFGGDTYGRVHTLFGRMTFTESAHLSTEALYEYKDQTYWDSDLFPSNSLRSGWRNSVGLTQNFTGGKASGFLIASGDFNRAEADFWSYDGFRVGAQLTYQLADPLSMTLSAEYRERRFRDDFPGFREKRKDQMQVYSVGAAYAITEKIAVYVAESYTINEANIGLFDYDRSITSLYLTVGLP